MLAVGRAEERVPPVGARHILLDARLALAEGGEARLLRGADGLPLRAQRAVLAQPLAPRGGALARRLARWVEAQQEGPHELPQLGGHAAAKGARAQGMQVCEAPARVQHGFPLGGGERRLW